MMTLKKKAKETEEKLTEITNSLNRRIVAIGSNYPDEVKKENIQRMKINIMAHSVLDSYNNWAAEWNAEDINIPKAVSLMLFSVMETLPVPFAWFAADWAMTEIMASGSAEEAMIKAELFFEKEASNTYNLIEEHIRSIP